MGDANLYIGATVDKDAVASGMDGAAAGVKQATTNISVYFQDLQSRASGAWKKISEDTRVAASSINAESLRIAESTKAVTVAQRELSAAMSLARNSSVDEAASMAVLAAAQANVRAKTLELKAAQEAVAEVTHKAVTDTQATSAAVRSFEGNPGIRAMENFVAKTLGLGPAMKNIFPLIGALAFASVLTGMGEKLLELRKKGQESAGELARGFGEMNEKLAASNDELELQNSKLNDQIAKISGHPTNGMETAILEAKVAADKLQESLASDLKTFQALLQEHDVSYFEGVLSNIAPTKGTTKEITEFQRSVEKQGEVAAAAYAEQLRAAGSSQKKQEAATRAYYARMDVIAGEAAAKMRQRATEVAAQQADLDRAALVNAQQGKMGVDPDLTQQRSSFEDAAVEFDKLARRAQLSGAAFQGNQQLGKAKQDRSDDGAANKAAEAERKADEEKYRAMEVAFNRERQQHELSLEEEREFWQARIGVFKEKSSEYAAINARLAELATSEFHKQDEIKKHAQEEARKADAEDEAALEAFTKKISEFAARQQADIEKTGESWASYWASVAKGKEASSKLSASMAEGQLHILEQEHGISALGAAQAQARIHTEEHTAALKALQDELAALKAAGAGLMPGDKGYAQNQTQQQNVQNQIQQQTGQGQQQAQADQAAINAAIAKPYLSAFGAINTGWLKVQNDLIAGNRNIRRDFAQMGLNLVQEAAKWAEGILAHEAQSLIRREAAHIAANQAKVASDAAAAGESTAIAQTEGLKTALIDAKGAAVAGFKAGMHMPFPVNIVMAPALAAIGFAGAISHFEDGGIVGGGAAPYQMGVPILAHAGERVLSYDQTQKFESMVNGGAGGGETNHYHMGNHNYSQAGGDFKSQLATHERHVVKFIKRLKREGKL